MSSHVMSTRDVCIENRIRCMELSCHCSKVLIERTRLQLLCARLGDVPLFSEQVQQSLASHLYTSEKNLMFINEQLSQYTGHPHFEHLAQLADQSRALSHELESLRSQIQSRKNHSRQLFT